MVSIVETNDVRLCVQVETDDPALRGCDITMQELGTNLLIITATSKRSGTGTLLRSVGACIHANMK